MLQQKAVSPRTIREVWLQPGSLVPRSGMVLCTFIAILAIFLCSCSTSVSGVNLRLYRCSVQRGPKSARLFRNLLSFFLVEVRRMRGSNFYLSSSAASCKIVSCKIGDVRAIVSYPPPLFRTRFSLDAFCCNRLNGSCGRCARRHIGWRMWSCARPHRRSLTPIFLRQAEA